MSRPLRQVLIIGSVLALFSASAFGQELYRVDWESMAGSPWSYTGWSPSVDCAVPPSPSGGCALRFTYDAGSYSTSFSGGRAEINFPTAYNELWIGHWNRYSSGFVWNGNGTKMDFLVLADRGQYNFAGNMAVGWKGSPNAPTSVASNQIVWGPTTQDFSVAYTAQTNVWVWVEEHFVINTPGQANGVYEFYINDVLKGRHTNVPYRDSSVTRGWSQFFHTAEWGGGGGTVPAAQYWWVDHTVISTSRIGMPGGAAPTGDTQSPSVPAGLSAQAASSSQINLSWSAATDNIGVTGYRIFRGGTQLAAVAGTSYSDTGLTASTAYTYTVAAYDAAGNASAQSSAASATTSATAGTPGTVTDLSASASGANSVNLSFTQVNDGTGQPAKYAVRYSSSGQLWGGAPDVTQGTCASPFQGTAVSGSLSCSVLGLTAATQYQFQLVSYRGTLNQGATFGGLSNVASAATSAGTPVITCDANNDGTSNVVDVQLSVNQALGAASCAADINRDGMCNVVDVQRIVNAALGGACVTGP